MGYMSELYLELQEGGWKEKDIKKIPNKFAWEMAGNKELRERIAKSNFRPIKK